MRVLVAVVLLALVFAGAAAVLDERVASFGVLQTGRVEVNAEPEDESVSLSVDAAGETVFVADNTRYARWKVTFAEPVPLTGMVVDMGNDWRSHVRGFRIRVWKEDGAVVEQPFRPRKLDCCWLEYRRKAPILARGMVIQPLPHGGRTLRKNQGTWALRNVRFLVERPAEVAGEGYRTVLAASALPFGLALGWVLVLLGLGRRSA